MKKITILALENCVIQAIADPQYCFSTANQILVSKNENPLFDISIVGLRKEVKLGNGHYSVHPNKLIDENHDTDLIIIPALFGDMSAAIESNKPFIPWIKKQYHKGAEIASLCVGAFLLAETGLLKNKKCSTHWGFINEFKEKYEDIDVQEGKIITEENGIYSSGGANSYWNLLLHLVEKYLNREMAIQVAKYFAIDISRSNQSVFVMFKGQKSHKDEAVIHAQEYIEQNVEEKITVDQLAEHVALGRRSFERRFRKATNNAVLEYIQRVKIESAKKQFEASYKNIHEVMYNVGYSDPKAFRNVFKKITGLTPIEYKNRYNKIDAIQP